MDDKSSPERGGGDVRRLFKHGEWYWLWVDGPDGRVWMLGKAHWMSADYLSVLLPDDACDERELERDGRLHKWHVLAFAAAVPPERSGSMIEIIVSSVPR